METSVQIVPKGLCYYDQVWRDMVAFTVERDVYTQDQIWVLQHHPVYTQGTSCVALPRESNADIPVVKTDRGGQITYHGPGQLILYLLLDLKRKGIGPKLLVRNVEQALIDVLQDLGLTANRVAGAPGVYLGSAKIAALGFRIKKGCCYHGLSLNLSMDLSPFEFIHPCGVPGQAITQLRDWVDTSDDDVTSLLLSKLCHHLKLKPVS